MKTTKYDDFSNIAVQYGLVTSMAEIAIKVTQEQQFNEAMKLVDNLDAPALAALSIYINVLLNDVSKKAA